MRIETLDARWLVEGVELTLEELAEATGVPESLLAELVEAGALEPQPRQARGWTFTAHCVSTVRSAGRLREHFELDAAGLSVALRLLERIEALEREVRMLRARR
jgi:chaperone modulatory protein CbpM